MTEGLTPKVTVSVIIEEMRMKLSEHLVDFDPLLKKVIEEELNTAINDKNIRSQIKLKVATFIDKVLEEVFNNYDLRKKTAEAVVKVLAEKI